MAYQPISQGKKQGYAPVAKQKTTARGPKPVPPLETNTPFAATKTGVAVNTVLGLPKSAVNVAKEIVQGTTRGAAATGGYIAARAIGKTPEEARKASFTPNTTFEKALFGAKPFNVQTEAVEPLQSFGVSKDTAEKIGAPALIGLTALDLFTGPGKRKAIESAITTANTIDDARKVLRNAGVSDEIVATSKLDEKVVAAKSPQDASKVVEEIAKQTLPPLPKPISKNTADPTAVFQKIAKETNPKKVEQDILNIAPILKDTPELPALGRLIANKTEPKEIESIITPVIKAAEIKALDKSPKRFSVNNPPIPKPNEVVVFFQKTEGPEQFVSTNLSETAKFAEDPSKIEIGVINKNDLIPTGFSDKDNAGIGTIPRSLADTIIANNRIVAQAEVPALPKLTPELAQAVKTRQADKVITNALLDRYKTAARKPVIQDSELAVAAKNPKADAGTLSALTGKIMTPVASRLSRINASLGTQLRKFEFNVSNNTQRQMSEVKPLLQAVSKMSKEDQQIFNLARLNGDTEVIDAITTRYGINDEYNRVRDVLNELFERAKNVGMDVQYRNEYFPRVIKNVKGYLSYWRGSDEWGDINRLIEEEARKKGIKYTDLLKDQEKLASMINNYIRGYGNKTVLAAPSFTKQRRLAVIDQELADFYEPADSGLLTYILRMNDEIEGRKFFGKKADGDADINDSIGAHVLKLVAEGKIKPNQQDEVSDILKARFARGRMNGALDTYRNLEYISTMGSITSAVTQLGDFAWSLYDNGFLPTAKAAVGKKKLTREQLGFDMSIMNEFSRDTWSGRGVEKVFKAVGLDKMARLGQETFVTATIDKLSKQAKANDPAFIKQLNDIFDQDEAIDVLTDLKNNKMSDNVKFLAFNRLLDFQPLTKSEMPEVYLTSPNGRMFYMLKTFTLKQYDIFRREAFDKIAKGDRKNVAEGLKNLTKLAVLFAGANATADEIKDLITGRETPPSDRVIDNLWRLLGASKFDVYQAREDGLGTAVMKKILPPASVIDRAYKDVTNFLEDKKYEKGPLKGEDYKLESTQTIPVGGKLYYWWFGRGAQKQEYKEAQSKKSPANLPDLPELPPLPPLPKLPKI